MRSQTDKPSEDPTSMWDALADAGEKPALAWGAGPSASEPPLAARHASSSGSGSGAAGGGAAKGGGGRRHAAGATTASSSGRGFGGSGAWLDAPGGAGGEDLLSERDLKGIEKEFPDGLTSVQVVDFFSRRGIRFSEATFRKFVQKGLLPRSRRVGRKGKHQGSLGLYPPTTVRRINAIKRLQSEGHTIEDIQRRFLRYRDEIEALERSFGTLFDGFEEELSAPRFDTRAKKALKKDLDEAREHALELLKEIERIEREVVGPMDLPPSAGAPGGAEDLL